MILDQQKLPRGQIDFALCRRWCVSSRAGSTPGPLRGRGRWRRLVARGAVEPAEPPSCAARTAMRGACRAGVGEGGAAARARGESNVAGTVTMEGG